MELALQTPQKTVSFEFQGGEPLSNFEIIKYIVEYSQKIKRDKTIYYSIVTNLTFLTDDMLHFFRKYNMSISTSLDGFEAIHNYNRPLLSSGNSFKVVSESLIKIRKTGINCGAIQTTTRAGLNYPEELIDEYLRQGINNIFIRPLTPLGIAAEKWSEIGYFAEEFVEFYEKCLNYIIAKNKAGVKIKEGHASIFLSKILHGYGINYMELRSPCGAGIGQIAYYYDGDIYTCDEGRMRGEAGDTTFLLGNVFNNTYNDLMESNVCKVVCKYSILESLPKCCDCVYSPYCGVCPVINYALENDIISQKPQNYKCKLYAGMLDTIFNLLKDEENKRIMEEWV